MAAEISARLEGRVGRLTLNRPQALHALNESMCAAMIAALQTWKTDAGVDCIVIDHAAGTRGFCAGGDIRMLQESGKSDGALARAFFHAEYRLNHLLHVFPKPVLAIMDGVTMGGGVGISAPAALRIATERTAFAMPETAIGLFPDVGGGWHLPRLPGEIGMYLALTGARLKGADCMEAGLATHYVEGGRIADLVGALVAGEQPHAAAARMASTPGAPAELTADNRAVIARAFALESVEAIFEALEQEDGAWARAQLAALRTKSPQTLKVAFRQLRAGGRMANFADVMKMEYRIACRVIHRHDFQDGVRAVLIDKDNAPHWAPDTLAGVTDALLDEIFAPLPAGQEWSPLEVE